MSRTHAGPRSDAHTTVDARDGADDTPQDDPRRRATLRAKRLLWFAPVYVVVAAALLWSAGQPWYELQLAEVETRSDASVPAEISARADVTGAELVAQPHTSHRCPVPDGTAGVPTGVAVGAAAALVGAAAALSRSVLLSAASGGLAVLAFRQLGALRASVEVPECGGAWMATQHGVAAATAAVVVAVALAIPLAWQTASASRAERAARRAEGDDTPGILDLVGRMVSNTVNRGDHGSSGADGTPTPPSR